MKVSVTIRGRLLRRNANVALSRYIKLQDPINCPYVKRGESPVYRDGERRNFCTNGPLPKLLGDVCFHFLMMR